MAECGLTNLAVCLPEKFLSYIAQALSLGIEPILKIIHYLLTEPVNINVLYPIWAIMVYVISLFYGLFFLFSGVNFIISGYDSAKRENAKAWIRNVVLMVLFVQASFLLYNLILEIASLLTTGVIELINPNFFLLTVDNITNFGLQFLLLVPYLAVLVLTILFLGLRYLVVVCGVLFFPLALFLYFIPPLQSYGKLILNITLMAIFVTFLDALLLLAASQLVNVGIFANFKIVLVTSAFLSTNVFMVLLLIFAIVKAVFGVLHSDVGRGVKMAVKYLV